ncbi:transcriptional regulator, IclR family [Roseomonas rosea]|uniref:Transcriptional regulator, IclR family n=1 Tax=Muricoccus roseus TaxID=198092 RepID=A0A1M6FLB5_9PROT|nr:IclR family transcriptional regulator [Roseomonas rosea]SHI98433.1 transcriptional regulator, IclR family [Roseomonas rosea]
MAAPSPGESGAGGQREVGAVVHAIGILRHLSTATAPLGVAAIARGTGISVSTCFNILRTLARARFVTFREADKTYALGLAVAELAAGFLGVSHAELIRPELQRLALKYGMLVVLWRVTEDGHIVLIDRAHSPTGVRVEMSAGIRLPMLIGAVGRCVAAALDLPEAELRRRFAGLRWQSPPSFESYLADTKAARDEGWSMDDGHLYRGLVTVASLVKDQAGQPRFGLSGITIAAQHEAAVFPALGEELRELAGLAGRTLFPAPAVIRNGE